MQNSTNSGLNYYNNNTIDNFTTSSYKHCNNTTKNRTNEGSYSASANSTASTSTMTTTKNVGGLVRVKQMKKSASMRKKPKILVLSLLVREEERTLPQDQHKMK